MFEIPAEAQLLFSTKALKNQGFVMHHRIVGLQFHLEPLLTNVREMVVNDYSYLAGSIFNQNAAAVLAQPVPAANKQILFNLLDYICG